VSDDIVIDYALPVSHVRIASTITETHDSLDPKDPAPRTPESVAVLEPGAGPRDRIVQIDPGWIGDSKLSFKFTEEGRLVSASATATGQGGKVILGVAGLGAAAAGLFLGVPGILATGAGLAAVQAAVDGTETEEAKRDPVAEAYAREHPEEFALRKRYAELVTDAVSKVKEAAERANDAAEESALQRAASDLRVWRLFLRVLRVELDTLDEHFRAWRATKISTRTEAHERLISLNTLCRAAPTVNAEGEVAFSGDEPAVQEVRDAWEQLGILVTVGTCPKADADSEPQARRNELVVRYPRRVTMSTYEREDGKAVLQESRTQLVLDDACPHRVVELPEAWIENESVEFTFSDAGALTGIIGSDTSGVASLAETLGSVPGTVSDALGKAKSITDAVVGFRSAATDQRLAQIEKAVKIKQQELAQAGLLATEGTHVELEKLKRQADILTQQKTIRDATPAAVVADPVADEIARLRQQIELLTAQREQSVAQRQLTAETALAAIEQELERRRRT
jgi:hypothetical protein